MRSARRLAAAVAILSFVTSAHAQSASPPRRAHHSIAYDESRQAIILTGGSTPLDGGSRFQFFNDLWQFDGRQWKALTPSGENVSGVALAYDTKRERVISFGGFNGNASLSDVRVLDNNAWKKLDGQSGFAAAEAGFVFDAARDCFVAFGGSPGRQRMNGETWEYDGSAWKKLEIASPPARQAHAMAYDRRRGRTIVFGGMGEGPPGQPPPLLGDTWEFDGKSWVRHEAAGPSARNGAGMTYDSKRGLIILFGGADATGFRNDTWSWNGIEWKQLSTSGPEPRAMGYIAYDSARDRVVMFGGRKGYPDGDLGDTWEWDGAKWKQFNSTVGGAAPP